MITSFQEAIHANTHIGTAFIQRTYIQVVKLSVVKLSQQSANAHRSPYVKLKQPVAKQNFNNT